MKWLVLVCFFVTFNAAAQEIISDSVSFEKTRALFVDTSDKNLEVLGIKKDVFDKLVEQYYADENEILKEEFRQKLLIAPIDEKNTYNFVLDASLNCGSSGCHSKIFKIDSAGNVLFIKMGEMFDCIYMNESVSYCVKIQ